MDIDSPENSTGSNEAARSIGSSSGFSAMHNNTSSMGLSSSFSMTPRPMLGSGSNGMMGGGLSNGGSHGQSGPMMGPGGPGNGPQEWEWLTMSL